MRIEFVYDTCGAILRRGLCLSGEHGNGTRTFNSLKHLLFLQQRHHQQRRPRWRKRQLEWQLEWQLEGQLEGCVGIGHLIFVILRLSIPRKTFAHIPTWPDIHSLAAEADVEGDKQSAQGISSSGGRAGGNGNGNGNGN